jgi:hypothetical protein
MLVLSTNDLNPQISIRLIFTQTSAFGPGRRGGHTCDVWSRQAFLVAPAEWFCKQRPAVARAAQIFARGDARTPRWAAHVS